ncbi:hypothetical protein [Tsukamurella sp. PLM1]|uniref:hypothetical protein n=1 Tax=Tsukamurella sp. PLM1 TaxID=2929795 RepID=UPI002058C289|nr:hypothetical protein [Tsukamurella sp. PLM1]BDH58918.1 hypothetical protein MTP03_38570 [Tsukamurella sp. PLM1]
MDPHQWDLEAHARALRVAERDDVIGALMAAAGIATDEAPITQPIPVIARAERPDTWLSAG